MGGVRRVRKNLNRGISLAKTGIVFRDSEVCLMTNDINKAKAFRDYCADNAFRSSLPNMYDIYQASIGVREKLMSGSLWN